MSKDGKIGMAQLNAMTLAELKSLEKKVAKAVLKFEDREKKKALSELKVKARELGFSLNELTGMESAKSAAAKKPGKKVPPKYANPADKTQTWTGRGRRPVWVGDALAAGKTLDDLMI